MPGERTPRKVPMMPDTDIGAFSTSDSNHSSRKSTALIVKSFSRSSIRSTSPSAKRLPRRKRLISSRGFQLAGSGASESMTGLANWPIFDIARLNSGMTSASCRLKTETSRRVSSASGPRSSERPSGSGRNEASSGIISSPKRGSSRSRMIHGRIRLTT